MWTTYAAKLAGKSGNQPSRSPLATDLPANRQADETRIEQGRKGKADKAKGSPSPPAAGGEGRGEEGRFCSDFPSPQPSPHSFLAGRGRRVTVAACLSSRPVPLASCPCL